MPEHLFKFLLRDDPYSQLRCFLLLGRSHVVAGKQVGNAAAFLLSDLASGISGEIMFVDGGMTAM